MIGSFVGGVFVQPASSTGASTDFVNAGTIPLMKIINNNPPLANWLIKFASAEMVIAYSPKSHFSEN